MSAEAMWPEGGRSAVLSVRGLTVAYGGVIAVNDVDLGVDAGELVGLIGPNGAGKTTVIDALTGYVEPRGGSVHLDGQSVDGWSPNARTHAGLVRTFQQLELFGDLTVRQNLLVAADSAARGSVALMEEAISVFELDDALDCSVQQLPAGRRRLVAAARALASGPRLLLLDEPAAGLDTDESAWLGERLKRLVDGGLAILLVDHDMPLVLSICSRIHVLNFGQTVAEGPPASITRDAAVVMAYLGEEG